MTRSLPAALAVLALTAACAAVPAPGGPANLVKNPFFTEAGPTHYTLTGSATWGDTGRPTEFSPKGVALRSHKRDGSVSQTVTGLAKGHRWFRFSVRGLPEPNFAVTHDDLFLKVEFSAGGKPLDGVSRKLYPLVEQARRDLGANGNGKRNGAAVWTTYALDFRLPFPEIDALTLTAGFRNGAAPTDRESAFFVTEFRLVPIPDPDDRPRVRKDAPSVAPADLVPLGGRWYYRPAAGEKPPAVFTAEHADRLFYRDDRFTNPFAENMSAWLRKGYKDVRGQLVAEDKYIPDSVTVRFDAATMAVRAHNLPNHPTAQFPGTRRGEGNPHYIQEFDSTYYLPLEPRRNPNARAMTAHNANRALPMGPIGIAVNGVVFYNPFDAGMEDAHDIMDRCCGHPSPDNRYHYHKYPVCVKTPFADEGDGHSPLIGWAFDGFPIYGPYETKGVMAKDCTENPLNEFNIHYDDIRGWHYHVTPGKFPYVIGGYWGEPDPRNIRRAPGGGAGAGGPGRPPGPPAGGGGVRVLPPFARDRLTLAPQQEKELADLEKEARAKLDAILTPEQRKKLDEARPPRKE
jgi:hypothetical protein